MKYYYPFTYKQAIRCAIYSLIFIILIIGVRYSSDLNRVYYQFYALAFLICIFVCKYIFFQKRKKDAIYISVNAARCLKMFECLIVCMLLMVFVGILMVYKDRGVWIENRLLWQMVMLIVSSFASLFYSFIVIFGGKSYVSGSFGMNYDEIKEIVEINTYDIMGTGIKKCEIITKDNKTCTEKFTLDEYDFLCSILKSS